MLSEQTKKLLKNHITTKRKLYDGLRKCNITLNNLAHGQFDMNKEITLHVIVALASLVKSEIKISKLLEKEGTQ